MRLVQVFSTIAAGALGLSACAPNHPIEALSNQLACSYLYGVHQASRDIPIKYDEVILGGSPAQSLIKLPDGTWVVNGFLLEERLVIQDEPININTGSDIFDAEATFRMTKEGDVVKVSVGCAGID